MKKTLLFFFGLFISPFLFSQEEIDTETIFATFESSQEFVQEMYDQITDYSTSGHSFQDYLLGDDNYNRSNQSFKFSVRLDQGELDNWAKNSLVYIGIPQSSTHQNPNNQIQPRQRTKVWLGSLLGIRRANLIIANKNSMENLTFQEKNVILGQAYFFRAFFHNEIMKF
jgi:hypothetical protein